MNHLWTDVTTQTQVSLFRLLFLAVVAQRKLTTLPVGVVVLPVHRTLLVDDRLKHTHINNDWTCVYNRLTFEVISIQNGRHSQSQSVFTDTELKFVKKKCYDRPD